MESSHEARSFDRATEQVIRAAADRMPSNHFPAAKVEYCSRAAAQFQSWAASIDCSFTFEIKGQVAFQSPAGFSGHLLKKELL